MLRGGGGGSLNAGWQRHTGQCSFGEEEILDPKPLYTQVQLAYGEEEIRTEGPPFPLYPGEVLKEPPTPLTIVPALTALRLSAIRDFTDAAGVAHVAGDEWQFVGPVSCQRGIKHFQQREFPTGFRMSCFKQNHGSWVVFG
jgi:hypothetical protein